MRKIHFLPRHMAEAIAPPPNCGIISIKTPSDPDAALNEGWSAILRLSFLDADDPKDQAGKESVLFDDAAAKRILAFVRENAGLDELVVHCDLGISRSAAVAILLGEYLGAPVFRQGVPVDPRYRQHNAHVYRVLYNMACALDDQPASVAEAPRTGRNDKPRD